MQWVRNGEISTLYVQTRWNGSHLSHSRETFDFPTFSCVCCEMWRCHRETTNSWDVKLLCWTCHASLTHFQHFHVCVKFLHWWHQCFGRGICHIHWVLKNLSHSDIHIELKPDQKAVCTKADNLYSPVNPQYRFSGRSGRRNLASASTQEPQAPQGPQELGCCCQWVALLLGLAEICTHPEKGSHQCLLPSPAHKTKTLGVGQGVEGTKILCSCVKVVENLYIDDTSPRKSRERARGRVCFYKLRFGLSLVIILLLVSVPKIDFLSCAVYPHDQCVCVCVYTCRYVYVCVCVHSCVF